MRHPAAMKPVMTIRRAVAAVLVAAACGGARATPPVAPEPLAADAAVVPAAHGELEHRAAADRGVPLGPVSLRPADAPPTTPPTADRRPMPDWRLLVALGGAFAAVAAYRVIGQRRSVTLPPDVFELLGEASLGGQQSVRVVRFGPRTLLVAVSAAGVRTLAEVNDPQVTERIVSACHGVDGTRATGRGARRPPAGRGTAEVSP